MANPDRTPYIGPPLSGRGLIWAHSRIISPNLSPSTFNTWYETIHIPDIINSTPSGGCNAAWRYRSQGPNNSRPYLALYPVPELSFVQSQEFKQVNMYHEMLPNGGPIQEVVDFDTRFYRRVQSFMRPSSFSHAVSASGMAAIIKCTGIQPAVGTDAEFDAWYREEHLAQVSLMPGWRRSTRFELVFQVSSKNKEVEEAPRYLAIHEFEEGTEVKRMPRVEWTERTRRVVETAIRVDEGLFTLMGGFGDMVMRI